MTDRLVTVVVNADEFPRPARDDRASCAASSAPTHGCSASYAPRGRRPTASRSAQRLAERREREANAVRARRDALAGITAGLRERREFVRRAHAARVAALGRARAGRRSAERELRRLLAARARAAGPRRARRPVGDPVGDRPVRVRRPERAAELRRRLGLLPVHAGHLEGPRRLDQARLPGVQGRAGPARRAAVGGRRRRAQLGLRRASSTRSEMGPSTSRAGLSRCSTRSRSAISASTTRTGTRACSRSRSRASGTRS